MNRLIKVLIRIVFLDISKAFDKVWHDARPTSIFNMYINDLVDSLSSNAKLFADDTLLFSVVHKANNAVKELN